MGFRLYSEKTPFSLVLLKNLDGPLGVPSFLIEFMIKKLAFFKKWNNRFLPSKRYSNNIKKFFLPDILAFYKMDIHFLSSIMMEISGGMPNLPKTQLSSLVLCGEPNGPAKPQFVKIKIIASRCQKVGRTFCAPLGPAFGWTKRRERGFRDSKFNWAFTNFKKIYILFYWAKPQSIQINPKLGLRPK